MRKLVVMSASVLAVLVVAGPALAHVSVQPTEGVTGSFSRFVVRVPTERDDASTIKVEVQFPPLAFVSFQDVPGWERTVEMQTLDEPLEVFGEELTETVGTVTWEGGEIEPGEFQEFGFSARMPEEGIGPIPAEAEPSGHGEYVVRGHQLSVPGEWILEIVARTGEFDEERTRVHVTVNA